MNAEPPLIEKRSRGFGLVWIVPLTAAVVGITLLVNNIREHGPTVSVTFQNGEGLEVGKTMVKYRDVTIGRVNQITLSKDRTHVEVRADLVKSASDLAVDGTRFWVVRPRIGVGWASGLDTLLSGSYIAVESGGDGPRRTQFEGLESPPPLTHGGAGRRVDLQAADAGSLNVGAPVYFHHFRVGQVIDEQLDVNTGGAHIVIFIDAPNDRFITGATRFWNASGIDLNISADGLKLRTQSAASVIAGGIAFDLRTDLAESPSGSDADFTLYKDEVAAMAPADGEPHFVRMRFEKPLRGLTVGAPIEFVGVEIGAVTSIDVGYEPNNQKFPVFVTGKLFPRRMGLAYTTLAAHAPTGTEDDMAPFVGRLVARGLRVQPRSGNLLTGSLYLAMDFIPSATKVKFDALARPLQLPTIESNSGELQTGISNVLKKINALPLDRLLEHADQDLSILHTTLAHVNGDVLPATTDALGSVKVTAQTLDQLLAEDSQFRSNVEETLTDVQRTLSSVKALADYLDRHPEALIKGRSGESKQ